MEIYVYVINTIILDHKVNYLVYESDRYCSLQRVKCLQFENVQPDTIIDFNKVGYLARNKLLLDWFRQIG